VEGKIDEYYYITMIICMFLTLFIFSANNRRFLKPVINGRGLRPEGYVHYEDEDAYKSKNILCHVLLLSPFNIILTFSCLMFSLRDGVVY